MSVRSQPTLAAVVLGALLLGALWFFSDSRAAGQAHDDALALWESKEPAAYSFVYTSCSGMCASCPLRITVEDGEVTKAVWLSERCTGDPADEALTIEGVFANEEFRRQGELADSFEIDYDPTWGFPARVDIRCPDGYADCGSSMEVTDFESLS